MPALKNNSACNFEQIRVEDDRLGVKGKRRKRHVRDRKKRGKEQTQREIHGARCVG